MIILQDMVVMGFSMLFYVLFSFESSLSFHILRLKNTFIHAHILHG